MVSVLNPQREHLNQSAEAGEKLYRDLYRAKFEHDHAREFAAIDVSSREDPFWGSTAAEALQKAIKQAPDGTFHLIKVGAPAAFKVGYTLDDDVDWSFNHAESPRVRIGLNGVSPHASREFDAIVDTGFTGFISMPMKDAIPLGLVLSGTTSATLADGSSSHKLTALGTAIVGEESNLGVVLLSLGSGPSDVLVGMEFLRAFNKTLFVRGQQVELVDTDLVAQLVSGTLEASKKNDVKAESQNRPPPKSAPVSDLSISRDRL
jgi:predicted aspartyl protease